MEGFEHQDREIFSKAIKAGKRTYFFDVKSTRNDDYYLSITESKKKIEQDGKFTYVKHKIFLYKEDFEKFRDGLDEVMKYIMNERPDMPQRNPQPNEHNQGQASSVPSAEKGNSYNSGVNFEDL